MSSLNVRNRVLPALALLTSAISVFLYIAHPGEPPPDPAAIQAHVALSATWHRALLAVEVAQLVIFALLAAAMARDGRRVTAAGVLTVIIGLTADIPHAAIEGFALPTLVKTMDARVLRHTVEAMYGSPEMMALFFIMVVPVAVGLLTLALARYGTKPARIAAVAAVIALGASLRWQELFPAFIVLLYAPLVIESFAASA